ncbi:plasmid recombination protein [Cardinium endosymbiont of Dermatophagoides farinae]|uniref:plasmid recombination protein n=1 Tax=Cardinium endosymbiont of Dermatophagoides farinae TaxID=2597823 RepID=UPI002103AD13|nr:plasmid recombination protein [Cardinium endosymbiont of Dermatophagoides farinae]
MTPDGRLSAKHYRHGTIKLQGYQNRYAEAMSFWLSVDRSFINWEKTHTSKEYYKSINKIERSIAETKYINTLNPFT